MLSHLRLICRAIKVQATSPVQWEYKSYRALTELNVRALAAYASADGLFDWPEYEKPGGDVIENGVTRSIRFDLLGRVLPKRIVIVETETESTEDGDGEEWPEAEEGERSG